MRIMIYYNLFLLKIREDVAKFVVMIGPLRVKIYFRTFVCDDVLDTIFLSFQVINISDKRADLAKHCPQVCINNYT